MRNYHAVLFIGFGFTAGWAFGSVRTGIGIAAIIGLVLLVVFAIIQVIKDAAAQSH